MSGLGLNITEKSLKKRGNINRNMDDNYTQVAISIKKSLVKRILMVIVTVLVIALAAANYVSSVTNVKPLIVFNEKTIETGCTEITIYRSLGFKNVNYNSEYGSNYCERLFFWQRIDEAVNELSSEQYEALMQIMKEKTAEADNGFLDEFQTFEAGIVYVEKEEKHYRIYCGGKLCRYFEYDGAFYNNIEGEDALSDDAYNWWKPYAISAEWDGRRFVDVKIEECDRGDGGNVYSIFPDKAAKKVNSSKNGEKRIADEIKNRSIAKACAYFGKVPAMDTCIELNKAKSEVDVYSSSTHSYDEKRETIRTEKVFRDKK